METKCLQSPADKKQYIGDLGKVLIQDYGKKKYYSPEEVEKSHKKTKWYDGFDFSCWGMSVFSSHEDFDKHHELSGETCNYVDMKAQMLSGISLSDVNFSEISNVNLDASWIDFGNIFEGIGDFFSSIDIGIDF